MRKFKKNIHLAKEYKLYQIKQEIAQYSRDYPTPKYLSFMLEMCLQGWEVKLYTATVSKYIFLTKKDIVYKIRFSNHKPIYSRQMENDCDYYVGISHKNSFTTEQIIEKINAQNNGTGN